MRAEHEIHSAIVRMRMYDACRVQHQRTTLSARKRSSSTPSRCRSATAWRCTARNASTSCRPSSAPSMRPPLRRNGHKCTNRQSVAAGSQVLAQRKDSHRAH